MGWLQSMVSFVCYINKSRGCTACCPLAFHMFCAVAAGARTLCIHTSYGYSGDHCRHVCRPRVLVPCKSGLGEAGSGEGLLRPHEAWASQAWSWEAGRCKGHRTFPTYAVLCAVVLMWPQCLVWLHYLSLNLNS